MNARFDYEQFLNLIETGKIDDAFDYRATFTPDYLYKFYSLATENPNDKKNQKRFHSLKNNSIWFANPEMQNDPYEFKGIYWEEEKLLAVGIQDYVFGNSKGPSWTYAGFRSSVNRCLENSDIGIDRLRLHRLRHTVATMLSEQPDVTVFNIMQLLGHTQIKTAQRYIDAQTDKRREKNKELMSRLSGSGKQ